MKKLWKIVAGRIQNKIFNLILFTVILLSAAVIVVFLGQSHMLTELVTDSNQRQKEAITEITSSVMDQSVTQTLERSNRSEAQIADGMFDAAGDRIMFLADYAARIMADPEAWEVLPFSAPNPALDGQWSLKVIFADGADRWNGEVRGKIGRLANMGENMIALCRAFDAANAYIALPEGVHMSISQSSLSWFSGGKPKSYDPRTRGWYRKAEEEGKLVFTDGEYDASSGAYCIECAAPVYGPDGSLCAVIGADLYLTEMEKVMRESQIEGEYQLLINQSGHAVLAPQEADFPMAEEERGTDLRGSGNELLRQIVNDALEGKHPGVQLGALEGRMFYITASPIETTGWTLISAYSQETAGKFAVMLQERNGEIQTDAMAQYRANTDRYRNSTIILLIVIAALMLIAALILGKRIVRPLKTITRRISELKDGNLEFKMEDAYRTGDEVEELAQSFATLSHKTMEYVETVKQVTAEKERIGAELSLATQIQNSMLPHIVPAFPDRTDFDVLGKMDPAKEVGGDFYDYFLIDPDHLCMLIADVSGKGVPAALFMMASKIILQSVAMLGKSPAEILQKTNDSVCTNNEAEMFVTVWLGILELSTGRLTAANAGHEYPALRNADGLFELYKDRHGFVIGGLEGAKYREYEIQLEPGSKLFVYTDGVPEATSAEKELFGTDRMIAALNEDPGASPEGILTNVRRAVDGFVKEAEQFDDLTMLCLEYKGPTLNA